MKSPDMGRKKILFISAFPLCNKTAGQNYSLNLINELKYEYDITFFSFSYKNHKNENFGDPIKLNKIRKLLSSFLIPFFHPFFCTRISFKIVWHLINHQKSYDIIYFDFSQILIYGLLTKKHPNTFFMAHDIIIQKAKRKNILFKRILIKWIYFTEKSLLRFVKNTLVFSEKDQRILKKVYSIDSNIVNFFIDHRINSCAISEQNNNVFVFYGAWNRDENWAGLEWFLNKYGNELKYNYLIIGGGISPKNQLYLKKFQNLKILGFVDNPYEIISKSQALIAPIFKGAGVKVKVLETLCCGIPVIGTPIAFEGIPKYFSGFFYLIRNNDSYFEMMNKTVEISKAEKQFFKDFIATKYSKTNFTNYIQHD